MTQSAGYMTGLVNDLLYGVNMLTLSGTTDFVTGMLSEVVIIGG